MRTFVPGVRTIVFICALLSTASSFSQSGIKSFLFNSRKEFGIALGPSFFLGDVGGNKGIDQSKGSGGLKHLNTSLVKLAKGAFLATYPTEWLGLRIGINHTVLEGADSQVPVSNNPNDGEQFRRRRNLSFKTSALEIHGLTEIYPLAFLGMQEEGYGLQPYVAFGGGFTKVNPKTKYKDNWVELAPLMLEGNGMTEYAGTKNWKKKQVLLVTEYNAGIGAKYYFGGNKFVGFEILHRGFITPGNNSDDLVDGVSTHYIDPAAFSRYLSPQQAAIAQELYFREDELIGRGGGTRLAPAVGEQRGDPKENDAWFSSVVRFGWMLTDKNSPSYRQSRQMRCPSFY